MLELVRSYLTLQQNAELQFNFSGPMKHNPAGYKLLTNADPANTVGSNAAAGAGPAKRVYVFCLRLIPVLHLVLQKGPCWVAYHSSDYPFF